MAAALALPPPSPIPSSSSRTSQAEPAHTPHHATSFQRLRSTLGLRTAAARANKSLPPPPASPVDEFSTVKPPKGKERERIDSPPITKGKEREKQREKEKKEKEKTKGKGKDKDKAKDQEKMNLMRRVATFRGRATPSPVPPPAPSPIPNSKSTQNPARRAGFTSFITPSIRQASLSSPTLTLSRAASPPNAVHHRPRPAVPLALAIADPGPSSSSAVPASSSSPIQSNAASPTQARPRKTSFQTPSSASPSSPAKAARGREIGTPMPLGIRAKDGDLVERKRSARIPPSPSTPTVHLYHPPRVATPHRGVGLSQRDGGTERDKDGERQMDRERTRYQHDDDDDNEFDMDSDASVSPPPTPTPGPRAQLSRSPPRASPIASRQTPMRTSTTPTGRATPPASPTLLRARTNSPSTPRRVVTPNTQASPHHQQQQTALRRNLTSASTSHLPAQDRSMSPPLTPTTGQRRPSVDVPRRGPIDAPAPAPTRRGSVDSHAPSHPSPLSPSPSAAARRPSVDSSVRRPSGEVQRRGSVSNNTSTPAPTNPSNARDSPTPVRRRVSAAGTASPSPTTPLPATPTRSNTTASASASASPSSPSPVRTRPVAPVQRAYAQNRHFSMSSGSLVLGTTPVHTPPVPASPVRGHHTAQSLGSFSPPPPPVTSSVMTTTGTSAPLGAGAARAVLRTAIGMIAREAGQGPPAHMCRTEQGLRDWEEVEVRVKELIKEEKVWRNKGGTGRDDESEERERRIFIEALRDGYVLCQLMNKLRASSIVRPNARSDAATANITKFLAACASYGMAREDLFSANDMLGLGLVDVRKESEKQKQKEAVARVAWTVVRLVRFVDEPESVRGKETRKESISGNGHGKENGNGNINRGGGFTGGEKIWLRGQGLGREKEKEREREREKEKGQGEDKSRRGRFGDLDRDLPQTPAGPYASDSVASRGGSVSTPNLFTSGLFNAPLSPSTRDRDRDAEPGNPISPRKMKRWTPPDDMPPLRSNSPGERELELVGSGSSGSPRTAIMRGAGGSDDKDKKEEADAMRDEAAQEALYSLRAVPQMRPPPKSPLRAKANKVDSTAAGGLLSWARSAAMPRSAGALSETLSRSPPRPTDDDDKHGGEEEDEEEEEGDDEFDAFGGGGAVLRGRPSFADSTRASIGDASVRDIERDFVPHTSHHRDNNQVQLQHSSTSANTRSSSSNASSPAKQFNPYGFNFPPSGHRNVRQSVASSAISADTEATTATTSAVSSLLDFGGAGRNSSGGYYGGYNGSSGGNNYGTIRTVTTDMTSEAPSVSRAEGTALAEEVKWRREMGGGASNASGGGMSGSPGGAKAIYGMGRERKLSESPMLDLSRVAEETDESVSSKGHSTSRGDRDRTRSPTHRPRQLQSQSPHNRAEKQQHSAPVNLHKGKWPDDFLDAFHPPASTSSLLPLKRAVTDQSRYTEDDDRPRASPLSISPPRKLAIVGARRGEGEGGLAPLPRRPTHRPRHSMDSSPALLPKDALLRREASPDSIASGSRVVLRRHSTKPGVVGRQGAYSPLAGGSDHASSPDSDGPSAAGGSKVSLSGAAAASGSVPVPFPRSVSAAAGDHAGTPSPRSSTGLDNGDRPRFLRGRFQSDVEGSARRKERPNSYDELSAASPRLRFESMVNLGGPSAHASASDLLARDSVDGSAVRMRLIVREDGKPPTHFQLGNCIGRGQFGSVYRALNLNTGQMVAVKRIRLEGLKEEEVTTLMREVHLVKSLSHPSIVKYEGMARDDDTLSIVLEYAENGSLGQTLKAFGKLNERLVASYVVKILEGLHYLHTSDVVHCDLKAANILTTKNGNVKLSDFGVSLNLRNLRAMEQEVKDVAGTPNWMAPEVIELKGASTKSDIWSLGCTVIELLTGRPPYAEIANSMSVMFRIVEDDIPPIPEDASDLLKHFLEQCFNKDPTQRPSAEILCEHPWLKKNWVALKELRPQDSIPFLRRVSTDLHKQDAVHYLAQLDIPDSPISGSPAGQISPITRRTSAASVRPLDNNDFAPRDHSFVKTTFSKPVTCRVCQLTVKKAGVICSQCSLISHVKCSENAPPTCDLRAQLLLYAQYAEKGNPTSAYSNPNGRETGQQVAMSDVAFVEHNTPRTSIDSPQPSRSPALLNNPEHPPTAFKFMAAFRRSRTSLTPEPVASVGPPSSSATPPPLKDTTEDPPARRRPAVLQKRPTERPLSMTSDSTGLSSLRSAATAAESFSSRRHTGQRSQLSGGSGRPVSDGAALDSRTHSSKITSSGRSEAPSEADRDHLGLPGSLPANSSTKKKHKAKSAPSGNCLVQ